MFFRLQKYWGHNKGTYFTYTDTVHVRPPRTHVQPHLVASPYGWMHPPFEKRGELQLHTAVWRMKCLLFFLWCLANRWDPVGDWLRNPKLWHPRRHPPTGWFTWFTATESEEVSSPYFLQFQPSEPFILLRLRLRKFIMVKLRYFRILITITKTFF